MKYISIQNAMKIKGYHKSVGNGRIERFGCEIPKGNFQPVSISPELISAMEYVQQCAGKRLGRPTFSGIYFDKDAIVCTNSYSLRVQRIKTPFILENKIIPIIALKAMKQGFYMSIENNIIRLSDGDTVIDTEFVNGKFPDYRSVIDIENIGTYTLVQLPLIDMTGIPIRKNRAKIQFDGDSVMLYEGCDRYINKFKTTVQFSIDWNQYQHINGKMVYIKNDMAPIINIDNLSWSVCTIVIPSRNYNGFEKNSFLDHVNFITNHTKVISVSRNFNLAHKNAVIFELKERIRQLEALLV